jgi:hypothetical protein
MEEDDENENNDRNGRPPRKKTSTFFRNEGLPNMSKLIAAQPTHVIYQPEGGLLFVKITETRKVDNLIVVHKCICWIPLRFRETCVLPEIESAIVLVEPGEEQSTGMTFYVKDAHINDKGTGSVLVLSNYRY